MDTHTNYNISSQPSSEGIDFNKLRIIIRKNWLLLLLIFLLVNAIAYLIIRYTPNLYQSTSELKLDIKKNAPDLGIKPFIEDQSMNIISGEIELIESKLFLARVLDSIDLDVSYFNKGKVLTFEFFGHVPFHVNYNITNPSYYNKQLFVEERGQSISILNYAGDIIAKGKYGEWIKLDGLTLEITKNPDFHSDEEMNCFFIINSKDVLLNYLSDNLIVEPLNFNANTINISFKDYNPLKAQAIVNTIDSMYLHYSNEQKNLTNKQKIDWVTNELTLIENKMEGFENYFESFILQNKTNRLDEDLQKTIAFINRIDSQRFELTKRITEVNRLNDGLKAKSDTFILPISFRQIFPISLNQNLERLQLLQLEQEKLKLSYNENTFAYRSKQKEIETIQKKTQQQITELKEIWLKRLQELNQQKNLLENEFANMPDKNTQFNKNLRFYKLYEEFYLMLMQSKSEFEIAQAGSTPDFKILSSASLPSVPISPKKFMIAGIGMVSSLVLILFFIGILYLLNNKITNIHELERLATVPVLGIIPTSRSYNTNKTDFHILQFPKSGLSEAIRTLRTNLDFFGGTSSIRTIAISSTISGEGKSFIAMNLGGMVALSSKKVILLDLDMRKYKPNIPVPINDKTKGISTILIGKHTWKECINKTSIEGFDYISSGPHPPNPSELLLNEEFTSLLEELKKSYDFIILDTPPVGLVTDGIIVMRKADLSIYVFRANYSKKDFLFTLKRLININKFSNITTVLNAQPSSDKMSYGYGYYEEANKKNLLRSIFRR